MSTPLLRGAHLRQRQNPHPRAGLPRSRLFKQLRVWAGWISLGVAGAAQSTPFGFVALGDMPYAPALISYPSYERLISRINAQTPVFSVHVGDFKSGNTLCSDEAFLEQLGFFGRFEGALVYTPGDNDWTDCHRVLAGRFDPRERLTRLRGLFFPGPRSLGQTPIALERQADQVPQFSKFVENARFSHQNVLFLTVHIVGSNNGLDEGGPAALAEFSGRDEAAVDWLKDGFAKADQERAKAMVIFFHADPVNRKKAPFDPEFKSGYARVIGRTLVPLAAGRNRPVLVVHGDSHEFKVDRPFQNAANQQLANLTRLVVPGGFDIRAVEVRVDPESAAVFSFNLIDNAVR